MQQFLPQHHRAIAARDVKLLLWIRAAAKTMREYIKRIHVKDSAQERVSECLRVRCDMTMANHLVAGGI